MDSKSVKATSLFVLLFFVILLSTPGEAAETRIGTICRMEMKHYGFCWFDKKCDRYCKSSLDASETSFKDSGNVLSDRNPKNVFNEIDEVTNTKHFEVSLCDAAGTMFVLPDLTFPHSVLRCQMVSCSENSLQSAKVFVEDEFLVFLEEWISVIEPKPPDPAVSNDVVKWGITTEISNMEILLFDLWDFIDELVELVSPLLVLNSLNSYWPICSDALKMVEEIHEKDLVSWSSVIFGYGFGTSVMSSIGLYKAMLIEKCLVLIEFFHFFHLAKNVNATLLVSIEDVLCNIPSDAELRDNTLEFLVMSRQVILFVKTWFEFHQSATDFMSGLRPQLPAPIFFVTTKVNVANLMLGFAGVEMQRPKLDDMKISKVASSSHLFACWILRTAFSCSFLANDIDFDCQISTLLEVHESCS
ncbi:hypothetical protein Sjap_026067 [Stephania japonica]|uniref:Uncharacterized protein n=1 Tax=Stephania japonica TaxID=461633 RepID=A0AAP0E2Y1_9MAGN